MTFLPRHEVLDVLQTDGRVTGVVTDQGEIPADIVVCCAGIWGPKIARMAGLNLPSPRSPTNSPGPARSRPCAGQTEEAVRPILRHQDADLYYRDRFDAIGIGYYGHRPMPVTADDILSVDEADGAMPSVLKFTEDDFADAWTETQALLPATPEAKVEEGINGLFSFTTDNLPAAGRVPGRQGLLGRRGGLGHPLRRRRHGPWPSGSSTATARPSTCTSATSTASSRTSCPRSTSWPATARTSSRSTTSCTRSSRPGTRARSAPAPSTPASRSSAPSSWRRTAGSARSGTRPTRPSWTAVRIPTPDDWAARYWSPIVGAEAQATRETVAMYDMTALKRLEVSGPGAADFLERLYHRQGRQVRRLGDLHPAARPRRLEDIRRNWPFLRDRRIDSYAPITNRLLD